MTKILVGFSGGVDSQATALWCRQRFPAENIILLNSDAGGNEHPITTEFVEEYGRTVFPVTVVSALVKDLGMRGTKEGATRDRRRQLDDDEPLTFDKLAFVKGRYPSRKAQFCTEYLKIAPQARWVRENLPGVPFERYIGVRWDESSDRARLPREDYDDYFHCKLVRPIIDWTKSQVFSFLKEHGERWNPLYEMGFRRVGCAPCINSSKDDIRNWAARFPEMIDKVRQWEAFVGRTFFAPMVPGKKINWIDEVVEWSKMTHGGKQYSLPFFEAEARSGGCTSVWGICE